jgi:hypothetical protein
LKWWQRELKIRDWDIRARLMPGLAENGQPLYGIVHRELSHQAAVIYLRPDGDWTLEDGSIMQPMPLEETLVHELLHIKIPKLPIYMEEVVINHLASLLYRMRQTLKQRRGRAVSSKSSLAREPQQAQQEEM